MIYIYIYIYLPINGVSDYDAQLLIINNDQKQESKCYTDIKRKISKYILTDFRLKLSHETWEGCLMRMMLIRFLNLSKYFLKNLLLKFFVISGKE